MKLTCDNLKLDLIICSLSRSIKIACVLWKYIDKNKFQKIKKQKQNQKITNKINLNNIHSKLRKSVGI